MQRFIRTTIYIGLGLCATLLFCLQVGNTHSALAQSASSAATVPPIPAAPAQPMAPSMVALPRPPADLPCRGCHGEKTDVLTFTSGETVTLGVDLAALDLSAHASTSDGDPMLCTGCHQNETRYRYPHADNPAQTHEDFALAVSQNCQNCHYPHLPFHDAEQTDYHAAHLRGMSRQPCYRPRREYAEQCAGQLSDLPHRQGLGLGARFCRPVARLWSRAPRAMPAAHAAPAAMKSGSSPGAIHCMPA